eukprot:SAG11_NODE_2804_length_2953_cov_4.938683_2_plen_266_part_00
MERDGAAHVGEDRTSSCNVKVFNDAIHGHITLPAVCVAVIDTPQFQRLKNLKQLGGVYYIFSCASHNRFEHSIGTAHLGGKLAKHLREIQPELGITNKDITCVQLAGLCHDLGHGPCSHMFEQFLHDIYTQKCTEGAGGEQPPTHEYLSCKLLDYLIEANGLMPEFEAAGLNAQDIIFIKEMIDHPVAQDGKTPLPPRGRPPAKHFLYDIISNESCGIDVDKFVSAQQSFQLSFAKFYCNRCFRTISCVMRGSSESTLGLIHTDL